MSLDPATVRRIAGLARIGVQEEELSKLSGELNGILTWIEQLNEVDVSAVDPMAEMTQVPMKMREDRVTDGGYPEQVLGNAPDRIGDYYAVPKVVE
jgi:aspartyl-tRNA(Asn)/glutamyl-tRNA(Gln) amidotransferase subunit C